MPYWFAQADPHGNITALLCLSELPSVSSLEMGKHLVALTSEQSDQIAQNPAAFCVRIEGETVYVERR